MTDMAVVVLADVQEKAGETNGKAWKKYTLVDGNSQTIGTFFNNAQLASEAKTFLGKRVEVDTKPASDPQFPPTVTAIRTAVEATGNGAGDTSLSKDEWRQKDAAGDKRACIAIAAGALTKTLPEQPTDVELETFAKRVDRMAHYWFELVQRQRDPVPFE